MSITNLTPAQLRQAANLKERIVALEQELVSLLGSTPASSSKPKAKRKHSAAGLANIKAAQKKRWAKINAGKSAAVKKIVVVAVPAKKKRKKMSAAAKAKQSAKMKAYWAAKKAAKKK